jgi:hypothetical protein
MGGFHISKIIHLSSIAIWSGFVFYSLHSTEIKFRSWFIYCSAFFVTILSGLMLLNGVGLRFDTQSVYPSWVYLKMIMTLLLFITGALSLKKLWFKAHWYFLIILSLLILTNFISVIKPYL